MATKLGSSPVLKLVTWLLGIFLFVVALSWFSEDKSLPQRSTETAQSDKDPRQIKKETEAAEKEKTALANDVKQLFARYEQVNKKNAELAEKLKLLSQNGGEVSGVEMTPQFSEADLAAIVDREVKRRLSEAQTPAQIHRGGTTNMNVSKSTDQALLDFSESASKKGAGVGLDGYVVGSNYSGVGEETVEWILPQDSSSKSDRTVFDSFFDKTSEKLDFGADRVSNNNKKKDIIQYATIDQDAILYNAMVLNDLIGVVASGDTVHAPFKFKLELSQENLATSGLYMPHIAMMRLSGYARGEWATGCVEGIITGATFVFNDGVISDISTGKGDGKQIGYLSDIHGSPCMKGKKYSDLMEYASISGGLSALSAAGNALASAQYSVQRSADNVLQTFDGSLLSNAVGQGSSQGINTINQVIASRYANVRDLVVAPAGQYVVMMSQQLNIDYDPNGRKVLNEKFDDELEAYHAKKHNAVSH